MSPEAPPPDPDREDRPRGDPRFGPESAASIERTLASLVDPDDAIRILALVKEGGAGFAAFLQLPDTNIAATDLDEAFHAAYVDAWESFNELRRDILEALGWLDAVKAVMTEQGIPEDQLIWNHPAIDIQIFDTYDAVHIDGWWHLFNK